MTILCEERVDLRDRVEYNYKKFSQKKNQFSAREHLLQEAQPKKKKTVITKINFQCISYI